MGLVLSSDGRDGPAVTQGTFGQNQKEVKEPAMSGEGCHRQRKNECKCPKVGVCGLVEHPGGKPVCWEQCGHRESGRRPGGRREWCGSQALSYIVIRTLVCVCVCVCMCVHTHGEIYII